MEVMSLYPKGKPNPNRAKQFNVMPLLLVMISNAPWGYHANVQNIAFTINALRFNLHLQNFLSHLQNSALMTALAKWHTNVTIIIIAIAKFVNLDN